MLRATGLLLGLYWQLAVLSNRTACLGRAITNRPQYWLSIIYAQITLR